MNRNVIVCLSVLLGVLAGTARAGLISIDTDNVYASSELDGTRIGDKLVDGSGLSGGQHDANANNMWLSGNGDTAGWVVFDLGAVYSVTNVQIWNYNESSIAARGVSNVVVRYGTNLTFGFDSSGFESTLTEITTLAQASGAAGEPGEAFDSFAPFNARYVLFDIVDNHGDASYVGLSEVQFYGTFVNAGPTVPPEITGVTVESVSTEFGGRPASATLNNNGLNILGHHTTGTSAMWLSNNEELPEIVYDLGNVYDLEALEVWNYNESAGGGLSTRGINGVDIEGSTDGVSFTPIVSTTFAQVPTPESSTTDFSELHPISVTYRYIKLDATSNHGAAGYTGISEIKFYGVVSSDSTDPLLASTDPGNGANGVGVNASLLAVFDDNITNKTGSITIKKTSDDSVVEAFNVATSPQLTWDYDAGKSVTIDPTSDLATKTGYYVEIDATAIDDEAGNSFAGFTGSGAWSFTTAGSLITNTTVEAFSSEYKLSAPQRQAVNCIDGSALPGDAPALYGAHGTAPTGDMWLTDVSSDSDTTPQDGFIIIDLAASYVLDTIHVWNYNETPSISASMKDVEISVSSTSDTNDLVRLTTDATGDTDNGSGDFLFPQAPGTGDYLGFNVDLTSLTDASLLESVRLVKIENTSTHGGSGTGLAEIQFGGDPWLAPPAGAVISIR
ncbi:MAG: hypothetical protein HN919_19945 [Verrucomicrobia bacterium]|jgi:hypothetical protein|nr:hypothetical protein [Verrucomicrobiota bacterium]MBT7068578.1 hypothetical protein [Verrucomicrobiota bacterium]MBT7699554.1 hypothetical protein [Verrucomicrobiota bacterium]